MNLKNKIELTFSDVNFEFDENVQPKLLRMAKNIAAKMVHPTGQSTAVSEAAESSTSITNDDKNRCGTSAENDNAMDENKNETQKEELMSTVIAEFISHACTSSGITDSLLLATLREPKEKKLKKVKRRCLVYLGIFKNVRF